uniref:NADH-ubiquinone oxidoreductase chain 2 n=1 Tax=Sicyonia parajaponica TaxID=2486369 RepID=A0A345WJ66_9EUCA|nr:NADH dehydrogenase subunit 2 [Sicyonia japonica]AXJ93109.1 NADH dehydrogenase subunit 2 [Sicyonia parajaponica]
MLLFSSTLFLGITLAISSSSWFGAWIGLELNLLSFIPIISHKDSQYSSEAALKYFLIQALGSSIIIMTAPMFLASQFQANVLICLALLLKAGAAPFHFWFPSVMEGLKWPQLILLMTAQKMAPLSLLSYLNFSSIYHLLIGAIVLSAFVGAIGGINQTLLRKILAYSSINHMAWMIAAMVISETSWLMYFLFYSIISSSIALLFYFQQIYHISQIFNHNSSSPSIKIMMFLSLLSLGGLPPFTGFIPKWLIMQELASANMIIILAVLLSSALLTLYYYLRISIPIFLISNPATKWMPKTKFKINYLPILVFVNFLGLFFPSLIIMII